MNDTGVYGAVIDELRGFDFGAVDRIILSAPKGGVRKALIRPIVLKNREAWQFEKFIGSQVFHENVADGDMPAALLALLAENGFREINIIAKAKSVHYRATKKGRLFRDERARGSGALAGMAAADMATAGMSSADMAAVRSRYKNAENKDSRNHSRDNIGHDRKKSYILTEGMPVMPLVDLGIFDADMRVKKSQFDKYRQINRFLEIIADSFIKSGASESEAHMRPRADFCAPDAEAAPAANSEASATSAAASDAHAALRPGSGAASGTSASAGAFTIIDFGCGKSYLTFLVYYYFTFILHLRVRIFGYDVKRDVVARCNEIAAKYGYVGIVFECADISRRMPPDMRADMMVTLHACDTATDYALYYAIKNKIRRIFSVPCCQHELNAKIERGDEFSLLLKHGLYKERFSAILTDCVRCEVLKDMGYGVDVVEFVSPENTLKNAMIRATLSPAALSNDAISAASAESAARTAALSGSAPYSNAKIAKLLAEFNVAHKLVELLSTGRTAAKMTD